MLTKCLKIQTALTQSQESLSKQQQQQHTHHGRFTNEKHSFNTFREVRSDACMEDFDPDSVTIYI